MDQSKRPIVIAKRHRFSSAHFYEQPKFSTEKNREVFGACYDPHGHGHDYILEAFVEGTIDSDLRLVADLADVDHVLKEVCKELDHHHLNFDIPEFKTTVPTTENLAHYLFARVQTALKARLPSTKLNRIRLFETDDIWVEVPVQPRASERSLTLTRQVEIRIIHLLENKKLTPEENVKCYGICYGRHGHHFKVQVTVKGSALDPQSGLIFDRATLDQILQKEVVEKYDGRDLNQYLENSSCEAFCQTLYDDLSKCFAAGSLVRISIQETRKNYFEFPPAGASVAT